MDYTKLHLSVIPKEEAHGGSGARQMLIMPEHITTPYLEAVTKGFLNPGSMFDWHQHIDTDEVFIVTQGQGKFYYKQGENESHFEYKIDDVIIAPANMDHKIVAEGEQTTEGFFFRIKGDAHVEHEHYFRQLRIDDIPFEAIHGIENSRKTLVTSDDVATDHLEAITKGILKAGNVWDWHNHTDIDEVSIVLKGKGKYLIGESETDYVTGNVFIIPANIQHKIHSTLDTEFYFIRVNVK